MSNRIDITQILQNKSVALVGNSQSLFDNNYGFEIDSHDVVIRINRAAMLHTHFDAIQTHGKKTTIWGVWDSNTFDRKALDNTVAIRVHVGPKPTGSMADYTIPREYISELKKTPRIKNPSSGLILLYFLTKINVTNVSVYGFDWKKTLTFTDTTKRDGHHTFPLEEKFCMEHIFILPNFTYVNMCK
jgi:hypothetical protein